MHKYEWDPVTGGILLLPQQEKNSKEPRPVYYREMNLLGMSKRWIYPQNDDAPIMWAEAEKYIYREKLLLVQRGDVSILHLTFFILGKKKVFQRGLFLCQLMFL